jgi:hypothetical protein
MAKESPTSWYREPYVWLLIAIPLASVVGSVITGRLALRSDDGVVVDDYYKRGLEINRALERDRKAAELGLHADIQLSPELDSFRIVLHGNDAFSPPDDLIVSFLHATRSGFDKQLAVKQTGDRLYQAPLPDLIKGSWHVQIEAGDWRVLKTLSIE